MFSTSLVCSRYAADFTAYANTGVALIVGLSSAAVLTGVLRAVGSAFAVGRLTRADGRTLADAARGRGRGNRARVVGLMLDRLSLAAPRLAALPAADAYRAPADRRPAVQAAE